MSTEHEQARDAARRPLSAGSAQRRRRAQLVCAVVLAGVVPVVVTGCQSEGGRRRGIRALQLRGVQGYVEFTARDRSQKQKSKRGAGDTRYDETVFEENLKLETEGFVYHPNLLDFSLAALFGLRQHDFENVFGDRLRTSGDEGPVYEFDFNGRMFQKKKYPGTVFARRYDALEPRAFLPSLEVTTTNVGFNWQYISDKTPTNLLFNHTDVRLDPQSETEEKGRQKTTLLRFETAYHFSRANTASLVYEHESREEEPFTLDFDTDEVTLSHVLGFGADGRHRLDSELNYFDQRGTFDIERLRWRQVLRLGHSDTLRSWYIFELVDRTQGSLAGVPPIEERSYSLTAAVEHKLYESLISQAYGFAHFQEFGSGLDSERFGVQLNFDYRKKNRWGVLLGKYRFLLQTEDRDGVGQSIEVLDESHAFRDPEPVTLGNPNVNVASIFVTAEDRTTVFQPDRDYTVTLIGNRIELRRVPTGGIVDGATVLIDYVFQIGSDYTLDTLNHDLEIKQQFDFGLTPYYRLRRQEQTIKPRSATGAIPEDITAHTVGAEFRRGMLRWKAEYENHDSSVDPFDAVRLSAAYTRRFQTGAVGVISARWAKIDHKPSNARETRFFTLEGRYRHPITPRLAVEGEAVYRNEEDSITGGDEGIDIDLSLEWFVRQTEFRVTYEFGEFDDDFRDSEFSNLFVQVRRRF